MKLRLILTGQTPLYQNNPEHLANPLDELNQEIKKLTGKTKKTIEDHKKIARLEFDAKLYWDDELGVIEPSWNVKKCLIEAARLRKFGKMIERGFSPFDPVVPLQHGGPKDVNALWKDGYWKIDTMGQRGQRVAKTRPFFKEWTLSLDAELDLNQMNLTNFDQVTADAGALIGLGDSRNMGFGRFTAQVEEL